MSACSICRREDRTAIEESHIAGMSLRAIAKAHPGTTAWSLRRHFAHVPLIIERQQKLQARQVQNDRATMKLPMRIEQLVVELERLTANAVRRRDYNSALRSITTRLQCLRTLAELSGQLRPGALGGEVVPGNVAGAGAAASVTVNLPGPGPTPTRDPERFVRLMKEIYNLSDRPPKIDPIM